MTRASLHLDGQRSYVSLGDVPTFFCGLRRYRLRLWFRGAVQPSPACLISLVHEGELACAVFLGGKSKVSPLLPVSDLPPGSTLCALRDVQGKYLLARIDVPICDLGWHELEWTVFDSSRNDMSVVIDGRKVKTTLLKADHPEDFKAFGDAVRYVFPSNFILGGLRQPGVASGVGHYFEGWVKYLTLEVGRMGDESFDVVARWPIDAGKGSALQDVLTFDKTRQALAHECKWDHNENPPTAAYFNGKASFTSHGRTGMGEGTGWEVGMWLKTSQVTPGAVLVVYDALGEQPVAEVLLHTPTEADTTFTLIDAGGRRLSVAIRNTLCDNKWHELVFRVFDPENNGVEVVVDGVRASMTVVVAESPHDLRFTSTVATVPEGFTGFLFLLTFGVLHYPAPEPVTVSECLTDASLSEGGADEDPPEINGVEWRPTLFPQLALCLGKEGVLETDLPPLGRTPAFRLQLSLKLLHVSRFAVIIGRGEGWSFSLSRGAGNAASLAAFTITTSEGVVVERHTTAATLWDGLWHQVSWETDDGEWIVQVDNVPVGLIDAKQPSHLPTGELADNTLRIHGDPAGCSVYVRDLSMSNKAGEAIFLPITESFGGSITVHPHGGRAVVRDSRWKGTRLPAASLLFDGESTYVTLGDTRPRFGPEHFQCFSLVLWIKCGNARKRQVVFSANDPRSPVLESSASVVLNHDSPGTISFIITDSCNRRLEAVSAVSIFDMTWRCLAWDVVDSCENKMQVFIDGQPAPLTFLRTEGPKALECGEFAVTMGSLCKGETLGGIVDHFEGYMRCVSLCVKGECVGCWPLEATTLATATDTQNNELTGFITDPRWRYAAMPPMSLCLGPYDSCIRVTPVHGCVARVGLWLRTVSRVKGTLLTASSRPGHVAFEIICNAIPTINGGTDERPGYLTLRVADGRVSGVVQPSHPLLESRWHEIEMGFDIAENAISFKVDGDSVPVTYSTRDTGPHKIMAEELWPYLAIGDDGRGRGLDGAIRDLNVWDPQGNLIMHLPLAESLVDVGRRRHVAAISNAYWALQELPPAALGFDGQSSYANMGTMGSFGASLGHPWSFSFYIKTAEPCSDGPQAIAACHEEDGAGMAVLLTEDWRLSVWVADHDSREFEARVPVEGFKDGSWHHVTCRFDSIPENDVTVEVDGTPAVAMYGECGGPRLFRPWRSSLLLGAVGRQDTIRNHFHGMLRGVTLVSKGEVVAQWPLATGYGAELADSSGNGHHGAALCPVWGTCTGVDQRPPPARPAVRDIFPEASFEVSRWCESGALSRLPPSRGGGVVMQGWPGSQGWKSGAPPPQWMQCNFRSLQSLAGLELLLHEAPESPVVYEVWVSPFLGEPPSVVHRGTTACRGRRVVVSFPEPLCCVRSVRVVT
eukprot:Sspe_Gene.2676::Locus_893_Transcript_1_1_Confidence_1.000_Length_4221::g.2676::m.2676